MKRGHKLHNYSQMMCKMPIYPSLPMCKVQAGNHSSDTLHLFPLLSFQHHRIESAQNMLVVFTEQHADDMFIVVIGCAAQCTLFASKHHKLHRCIVCYMSGINVIAGFKYYIGELYHYNYVRNQFGMHSIDITGLLFFIFLLTTSKMKCANYVFMVY